MDAQVRKTMIEASSLSDEGSRSFAEIVGSLIKAGVERYHSDFLRSEKIYYLPNGLSEVVPNDKIDIVPSGKFDAAEVESAVRDVQAAKIRYKEFCAQVMRAGCVGYIVSIAGQRVIYYGRTGDNHIEYFPGSRQ